MTLLYKDVFHFILSLDGRQVIPGLIVLPSNGGAAFGYLV